MERTEEKRTSVKTMTRCYHTLDRMFYLQTVSDPNTSNGLTPDNDKY